MNFHYPSDNVELLIGRLYLASARAETLQVEILRSSTSRLRQPPSLPSINLNIQDSISTTRIDFNFAFVSEFLRMAKKIRGTWQQKET